jgi:hypothetical protein
MDKKRFKLTFRMILVRNGWNKVQRAIIIAVAPIPGQKAWIQAILALEDGNMTQKPISVAEFELASRNEITMMEADGEAAAPTLYSIGQAG